MPPLSVSPDLRPLPPGAVAWHQGKPVYDERDRLVLLTPCFDCYCTTYWHTSVTECRMGPVAQFRLADGSIEILPILAEVITLSHESHIDRARNTLAYVFEQGRWRFGLWMDGDQQFTRDNLRRLWLHLLHGHLVVGGLVAFKSVVPRYVGNKSKGAVPDSVNLIDVEEIGTGCLAFNRQVLDLFRAKWPEIAFTTPPPSAYAGKTMHAYFSSGVADESAGRNWLPEDWTFCRRCRELGIKLKTDVSVNIQHLGRVLFPIPPEEIIEAALVYTSGKRPPFDAKLAAEAHAVLERLHHSITDDSISIIHPTRRPAQALRIRELWLSRASNPKGIEYIFGVDEGDLGDGTLNASLTHKCDNFPHVPTVVTIARQSAIPNPQSAIAAAPGKGVVAAINTAAAAAKGRVLVMAADDCEPPQNWDILIREALKGQLHEPRLLWTSDGYTQQPVCTHPIITRALYEQQGYFFCPEYPHLFCDTELSHRALAAGQVVPALHIVLKHQHPMFTGAKGDALHIERNSAEAWKIGQEIFNRRNPDAKHTHAPA